MAYQIAKALHILGIVLWIGVIPLEIFCRYRVYQSESARERYGYLRVVNRLRYFQEFPGILLTVLAGLWMASIFGFEALWSQPWFRIKLPLIGYLVFAEIYLGSQAIRLERWCREHAELVGAAVTRGDRRFEASVIIDMLAMMAGSGIIMLAMFRTLPWLAVALAGLQGTLTLVVEMQRPWAAKTARPAELSRVE